MCPILLSWLRCSLKVHALAIATLLTFLARWLLTASIENHRLRSESFTHSLSVNMNWYFFLYRELLQHWQNITLPAVFFSCFNSLADSSLVRGLDASQDGGAGPPSLPWMSTPSSQPGCWISLPCSHIQRRRAWWENQVSGWCLWTVGLMYQLNIIFVAVLCSGGSQTGIFDCPSMWIKKCSKARWTLYNHIVRFCKVQYFWLLLFSLKTH